uniref:Vacuolar transport chaperone-like protein n=1 Tax=Tetraselmis sp. GSL018 TaxID=582737 RepID=A0A061QWJ2_9CHLO|mmetsp:Transcript_16100/g.38177  ORF Transcript_16100/g.38177 Transcript_16100/m.38177 type:complete len:202 (+) Transcript_16100:213-818(+)
MGETGESSQSALSEPLLNQAQREPSSASNVMEAHSIYQTDYCGLPRRGCKEMLRHALGIYSYKDPSLMSKPRKIPMRVEPKTYFALERTLLNWVSMSMALGTLGATLLGFSAGPTAALGPASRAFMTPAALQLIAMMLLPLGIALLIYSAWVYHERVKALKAKEMRYFEDRVCPTAVSVFIIIALSGLFATRLADFVGHPL